MATAIGRYLIRAGRLVSRASSQRAASGGRREGRQGRARSSKFGSAALVVCRPSWSSCASGDTPGRLGANTVPATLFLPDGRAIPTCVVQATPDESMPPPAPGPAQTSALLGGGYSCMRSDQGLNQLGTFACLVYRQGSYYALTNRHVAGPAGSPIKAFVAGDYVPVGVSADIGMTRAAVLRGVSGVAGCPHAHGLRRGPGASQQRQ